MTEKVLGTGDVMINKTGGGEGCIDVFTYLSGEGRSHCGVDKWSPEWWERISHVMISASQEKTVCVEISSQEEVWPFEESEESSMAGA